MGNQRMLICNKCPIFDKNTKVCVKVKGGCGCSMDKKVLVQEATCPKDKW
jgi:hypothetical protein